MDPCDYLVPDCWRHLVQFLTAVDRHSLSQTCESLNAILEPGKVTWSFELVLPYILKELCGKHRYYANDVRTKKELKSVLTLRQVCKSWRAAFDKFCETYSNRFQQRLRFPDPDPIQRVFRNIHRKYDFDEVYAILPENDDVSALEKFLVFFKAHQGNPFIGRRVLINAMSIGADEQGEQEEYLENVEAEVNEENEASDKIEMDEPGNGNEEDENHEEDDAAAADEDHEEDDGFDEEELRQAQEEERREREWIVRNRQLVMELLPKFGKEIDDLSMDLKDNCPLLEAYKCLQIVLNNCLNLKSLELFCEFVEETRNEQDGALPKALAEYFERNQLPKMDRLQDLIMSDMDARLVKLMLKTYGQNLQRLRLQRYGTSDIPVAIWGNMKCLRNLHVPVSTVSSNEQTVKLLQAINSPLETLTVEIQIPDDDEGTHTHDAGSQKLLVFKMDKFLLAIQHLPLKEISIEPESGTQFTEEAPFPADFPKHQTISKFSIRYCRVYSPNFLQFLPNLQTFVVNGGKCLMKFNANK